MAVHKEGSTQRGWGLVEENGPGFMSRYAGGEFSAARRLHAFDRGAPFAFVMRSARLVVIDIDGKNGGLSHIDRLGALPRTLAETSKSGNGYHLFYYVQEEWSETEGFGEIPDKIGIVQGVDIRALGCVYHYPTQRWNDREVAMLPDWLKDKLIASKTRRDAVRAQLKKTHTLDPLEALLVHEELKTELAKPIGDGKRNNTLYALGVKMVLAGVPDWEDLIRNRGYEVGLETRELDSLVSNIIKTA